MESSLNKTYVELHVPDFDPVKDFYTGLGFEVLWEDEGEEGDGYLVMEYEGNILAFYGGEDGVYNHSYFGNFAKDTKKGYGVEIALIVDNIEEFYKRSKEKGSIKRELGERPWGIRDFRMEDPFGFYLRVSEPHDIRG